MVISNKSIYAENAYKHVGITRKVHKSNGYLGLPKYPQHDTHTHTYTHTCTISHIHLYHYLIHITQNTKLFDP